MNDFITVSVIKGKLHHHGYTSGSEAFERARCGAEIYFRSWPEIESIAVFELCAPFTKRFELIRERLPCRPDGGRDGSGHLI